MPSLALGIHLPEMSRFQPGVLGTRDLQERAPRRGTYAEILAGPSFPFASRGQHEGAELMQVLRGFDYCVVGLFSLLSDWSTSSQARSGNAVRFPCFMLRPSLQKVPLRNGTTRDHLNKDE